MSITMEGENTILKEGEKPKEKASVLAKEIFNYNKEIKFNITKTEGNLYFGEQNNIAEPEGDSYWANSIKWWTDQSKYGYYIIKISTTNTPALISDGRDVNRRWFKVHDRASKRRR